MGWYLSLVCLHGFIKEFVTRKSEFDDLDDKVRCRKEPPIRTLAASAHSDWTSRDAVLLHSSHINDCHVSVRSRSSWACDVVEVVAAILFSWQPFGVYNGDSSSRHGSFVWFNVSSLGFAGLLGNSHPIVRALKFVILQKGPASLRRGHRENPLTTICVWIRKGTCFQRMPGHTFRAP